VVAAVESTPVYDAGRASSKNNTPSVGFSMYGAAGVKPIERYISTAWVIVGNVFNTSRCIPWACACEISSRITARPIPPAR
jgi:hypothetical protein